MMKKLLMMMAFMAVFAMNGCGGGDDGGTPVTPVTPSEDSGSSDEKEKGDNPKDDDVPEVSVRLVGGDISLLPTYEEHGARYYTTDGTAISNVLDYLKGRGWNAMRVRLFVDPSKAPTEARGQGVRQDLQYVIALCKRIKGAGMALLLDFHYSDTWADPSAQWTPLAWQNLNDTQLQAKIYEYTSDCLNQLNAAGATPDYIQTGNEISYGMLWGPTGSEGNRCYMGSEANWSRFAMLLKQAVKACRDQCPKAKVVLHTERVKQPAVMLNFYNQMSKLGVSYDVIGLSYYPYYHGNLNGLNSALTQLESTYTDKRIMVVETGHSYAYEMGDEATGYELSAEGQRRFTADLVKVLKQHDHVDGLFWWFPEANEYGLDWNTKRVTDNWYNASLFDNRTGRALPAVDELGGF